MAQVFVCSELEMKDGDVRIVRQDRVEVGIYRHAGSYYAYRNLCAHQGGPACKVIDLFGPDRGFLGQTYDEGEPHIVCPWHGWEYKLKTGECAPDPKIRLRRHKVVQREGGIYVVI
jgi:nitrite reductase/ring-hydroxylating ferredoxin subunit